MDRMQHPPPAGNQENTEVSDDIRLTRAASWAAARLGQRAVELCPIKQDASFRRYFRVHTGAGTLILMDAPPEFENSAPFLDVAARLRQAGLHAPEVFHFDLEQGFGLLEDLGDRLYRDLVTPHTADELFPDLFLVLTRMAQKVNCRGLPQYDHNRLQTELRLFTDWYLLRHRQYTLDARQERAWRRLCAELQRSAAAQPQVFVHRDFHSSNLLYRRGGEPGIIDFQDAVRGPISYDFVSLLWDRHVAWPRWQLECWMEAYRVMLGLDIEPAAWVRWCDLVGVQRNLKIVGIFARLYHRDGKESYLQMIPAFYRYLLDVLPRYAEFGCFLEILEQPQCAP